MENLITYWNIITKTLKDGGTPSNRMLFTLDTNILNISLRILMLQKTLFSLKGVFFQIGKYLPEWTKETKRLKKLNGQCITNGSIIWLIYLKWTYRGWFICKPHLKKVLNGSKKGLEARKVPLTWGIYRGFMTCIRNGFWKKENLRYWSWMLIKNLKVMFREEGKC